MTNKLPILADTLAVVRVCDEVSPSAHPDDLAVDAFALIMKAKLKASREKGRHGWDNPNECTVEDLSIMLRVHVGKGDPVDVANFCMMLFHRGSQIVKPPVRIGGSLEQIYRQIDAALEQDREREAALKGRRSPERAGGRRHED